MSAKLFALMLFVCATGMALHARAERIVYSIAIGNNEPAAEGNLRPLRYADDDAVRFHEFFSRFSRRTELLTVLDPATQVRHPKLTELARIPTLSQLRSVLQGYRTAMAADLQQGNKPVLYLSFSGHGTLARSGEYALVFLDGGMTQRSLYEEVLAQFEEVPVHLFIDACHAAGVVGVKGPFDHELEVTTAQLDDEKRDKISRQRSLARFPNVGVILAASSTEESHEWSRIESGVFTHEILSGLFGAADVNGDYRIEYSELSAFVSAANRGLPEGAAKPNVIAVPPAANQRAVLVDLLELKNSTLLAGVPRNLGHFYIETGAGERVLDAHFEQDQPITLALPASSTRLYLRESSREAELPQRPFVNLAMLGFGTPRTEGRGSVEGALRDGLFSSAYGADYYRGFVDSQRMVAVEFGTPRALPSGELPLAPAWQGPSAATPPSGSSDRSGGHAQSRVWPAYGLAIASGAALLTSVAFGIVALDARQRFNHTSKQREGHELADRYATFGDASLVAAAFGIGAGIGAFALWPRATVVPSGAGRIGGITLTMSQSF